MHGALPGLEESLEPALQMCSLRIRSQDTNVCRKLKSYSRTGATHGDFVYEEDL
jgi:hypothetical protein